MAGVLLGSILISAGVTLLRSRLLGAIRSEVDLGAMLPPKLMILGTIPPISSQADMKHTRMLTVRMVVVSLLASAALAAFLLKVRPIL